MPYSEGTITPADVSALLGVPSDARMVSATDAARLYVEVHKINPDGLWFDADVHQGGCLYAAGLYLSRVTPEGMAGYDPSLSSPGFDLIYRAKALLRLDIGFA